MNARLLSRTLALLACAFACLAARAEPASTESVERLLAMTKVEATLDVVYGSLEKLMRQSLQQSMQGKVSDAQRQRVLDTVPQRFAALMRTEMSWDKLKPQYVQLYAETFDQQEVDGLIAFYSTPAGRAYIEKMPLVAQKSLAISQGLMQSVMPKMIAVVQQAVDEAKSAK